MDGAGPALRGFKYQIDATIWCALDCIFTRNWCDHVTIEPASGEDLELARRHEARDAEPVPHESPLWKERIETWSRADRGSAAEPIQIQIKLKSSSWSKTAFKDLLHGDTKLKPASTPGPPRRLRAFEQLRADERLRYVLFTNAQVDPKLDDFVVQNLGELSAASQVPGADGDSAGIAARIGILAERTPKQLRFEILEVLSACHVPARRRERCLESLQKKVWESIAAPEAWRRPFDRATLESILRAHDGLVVPQGRFVRPKSYDRLLQLLSNHHRLVLVGQPGAGKTRVAEELACEHRTQNPPFEVLGVDAGVGVIRERLHTPERTLFYLEDPWGYDRLDQDAVRWLEELPVLMGSARDDKRFLITTRKNIFVDALDEAETKRAGAPLREAIFNFGNTEFDANARAHLLANAFADKHLSLEDLPDGMRTQACKALERPISYECFAAEVREARARKRRNVDWDKLLRRARAERLTPAVARWATRLEGRALDAAVIIWALVEGRIELTVERRRALSREMRRNGVELGQGLRSVESALTRYGWARVTGDGLRVHPLALTGLRQGLAKRRDLAKPAIAELLRCERALDDRARLHVAAAAFEARMRVPKSARRRLETRLSERLAEVAAKALAGRIPATAFDEAYDDLARFAVIVSPSDHASPLTALAGALGRKEKNRMRLHWSVPKRFRERLPQLREDARVPAVMRAFIRWRVRYERAFDEELLELMEEANASCTDEFRRLASDPEVLEDPGAELIVQGALRGPNPPFEEVFAAGRRMVAEAEAWASREAERLRQAEQDELDAAYAEHLYELHQQRFDPGHVVLAAATLERCRRDGFGWLLEPAPDPLLFDALAQMFRSNLGRAPRPTATELPALLDRCPPASLPELLSQIFAGADARELEVSLDEVVRIPPATWIEVLDHVGRFDLQDRVHEHARAWLKAQLPKLSSRERLEVAAGTHRASSERWRAVVRACLSPAEDEALQAVDGGQTKACSSAATAVLESLIDAPPTILGARALALLTPVNPRARGRRDAFLAATDAKVRAAAVASLDSKENEDRARLELLLEDEDHRVRGATIRVLAACPDPAARQRVVERGRDRSATVRKAVAESIRRYRWTDALEVAVQLLDDRWDSSGGYPYSDPCFEVAREAAKAVHVLGRHGTAVEAHVLAFFRAAGAQTDVGVLILLTPTLANGTEDAVKLLEELADPGGPETALARAARKMLANRTGAPQPDPAQ